MLLRWISDLRSRGDESREEKRIAGSEMSAEPSVELFVEVIVVDRGSEEAVVGGLLFILGVGASSREA